jgi:hypothetical protein
MKYVSQLATTVPDAVKHFTVVNYECRIVKDHIYGCKLGIDKISCSFKASANVIKLLYQFGGVFTTVYFLCNL